MVDLPTLTEKDVDDILNWGVANEIDFIAASFVRKGRDLDEIREVLGDKGRCAAVAVAGEERECADAVKRRAHRGGGWGRRGLYSRSRVSTKVLETRAGGAVQRGCAVCNDFAKSM